MTGVMFVMWTTEGMNVAILSEREGAHCEGIARAILSPLRA